MGIRVRLLGSGERVVEGAKTVAEAIRALGMAASEVVAIKGGAIVTEDEPLSDGDELILFVVKSGG